MLLLWLRAVRLNGVVPVTLTITDLIINARKEMVLAAEVGDSKMETFWSEAMDRFLDAFAREGQALTSSSDELQG